MAAINVRAPRLGAWWRFWIVLTIGWLGIGTLGFAVYQSNYDHASIQRQYESCQRIAPHDNNWLITECMKNNSNSLTIARNENYYTPAIALAAIIAGFLWVIGILIYVAVRWIWAGRRRSEQVAPVIRR